MMTLWEGTAALMQLLLHREDMEGVGRACARARLVSIDSDDAAALLDQPAIFGLGQRVADDILRVQHGVNHFAPVL